MKNELIWIGLALALAYIMTHQAASGAVQGSGTTGSGIPVTYPTGGSVLGYNPGGTPGIWGGSGGVPSGGVPAGSGTIFEAH
jgi:hypothetical protein